MLNNESAAEHSVTVVQNGRLPSCRGAHGLVADYAHPVALCISGAGGVFPLRVAHAHRCAHRLCRNVAQPVKVARYDLGFEKLLPQGKLYLVGFDVYRGDVQLALVIKPGAALTDRVAMYALVTADDLAVEYKVSGRGPLGASGQP